MAEAREQIGRLEHLERRRALALDHAFEEGAGLGEAELEEPPKKSGWAAGDGAGAGLGVGDGLGAGVGDGAGTGLNWASTGCVFAIFSDVSVDSFRMVLKNIQHGLVTGDLKKAMGADPKYQLLIQALSPLESDRNNRTQRLAELVGRMLAKAPDCSAIFCCNDDLAHGAIYQCQRRGILSPAYCLGDSFPQFGMLNESG